MADGVEFSLFTQKELRRLAKFVSVMGEDAIAEARVVSSNLAAKALEEIKKTARSRIVGKAGTMRVVDGAKVSKTSKTGQISFGFASQKFSGGGTTGILWPGLEFGSKKYKQFPSWSGKYGGRGSRGWVIYPTLREFQPQLTEEWVLAMDKIIKDWPNG